VTAAALAAVVAWRTRNLAVTIALGLATFWLLRLF
jgi:branched-subunit amino acid transport protein